MKIWLINHYAVPPQYYPLARPSLFAKNLIRMGHDVTIIAASTAHNSDKNLIEGREKVKKLTDDGIPYVLIKCTDYHGNGAKRVVNILEFAKNLPGVLNTLEKPDAIVATSFDPISCYEAIKYAKKHGIKAVAEIADLWPETLVVYNGVNPRNPIVRYLRKLEKKIYTMADAVVFTMEQAYDYIIDQGWEKEIPKEKVYYINNGIDIKAFDKNIRLYTVQDKDLEDQETFKIIYTGAIRKVNNLGKLLDIAKNIRNPQIRFLIWGDGDELESLEKRVSEEQITNVVFKGRVEKKYIPYITSRADVNFAHNEDSAIFRYGVSFNKLFDYLAAGKPIICDFKSNGNPVVTRHAGIELLGDSAAIAKGIDEMANMPANAYDSYCKNARHTAEHEYDFEILTQKLLDILELIIK